MFPLANKYAINIVTSHCEPEALHRMVYRAKGAAITPPPNPPPLEGEGEGGGDCFIVPRSAGLLAMTLFLLRLY